MANPVMIPPVSPTEKPCETIVPTATIETDRAIRLALAAQRRAMQEALREVSHG